MMRRNVQRTDVPALHGSPLVSVRVNHPATRETSASASGAEAYPGMCLSYEARRLNRRLEQLRVLVFGRIPVGVHEQLVTAVVGGLKRSHGVDVNDTAARHLHALGR